MDVQIKERAEEWVDKHKTVDNKCSPDDEARSIIIALLSALQAAEEENKSLIQEQIANNNLISGLLAELEEAKKDQGGTKVSDNSNPRWDSDLETYIENTYWPNPEDAIGDIRKFISLRREALAAHNCSVCHECDGTGFVSH